MKYINKLKEFKGTESSKSLEQQFEDLATYFLTNGYFCVNGARKVYICDVEFYYHEEYGKIKDYIMYHRADKGIESKDKYPELEYFSMGQFNAHNSGIDITFEDKENKKYRAGMLIRGFKIEDETSQENAENNGKYDERSTFFYKALLNYKQGEGNHTIEWVEKDDHPYKNDEIIQTTRKNVYEYHQESEKIATKKITTDSKKFVPCDRKWRFRFKNIKKL